MNEVCTRGVDTGFVALGYAKVAILCVVQGITELMPISSTAHMRLVPAFVTKWPNLFRPYSQSSSFASLSWCLRRWRLMTTMQSNFLGFALLIILAIVAVEAARYMIAP